MNSSTAMNRPRVLVLAYMVSPVRGTEYAVAWNYIRTMRAHSDLTILYGAAGPHMGDVVDFPEANFIDRDSQGDVRFHFVTEPRAARWLNALNRRGILKYSFYLAYRRWHRAALTDARDFLARERFDLIHYLGPIGYREPGDLWKLSLPYVWGPIGGVTSFPWRYGTTMPLKGRLALVARTIGNALQLRFSRRVDQALRRTDVLLTATTGVQAIFAERKGVSSIYLPENGIEDAITLNRDKFPATPLRIAWIGSLEARKGLILLLKALARLRDPKAICLDIFGDGPLKPQLQTRAAELGIDQHLTWHGRVPRQRVLEGLDKAHLHIITGLNEANTTSIWEALGRSVPVLALDHCGMHDVVQPPYGIRVPVTGIEDTIVGIATALEQLLAAPDQLEEMARSCATACDHYRIVHRPAMFLEAYRIAMARFHGREARP